MVQSLDIIKRTVKLEGMVDIMFDRYAGDNKTQLPVEAKMYYLPDGETLCIPAINLQSFLSAKNTTSMAKQLGGRGYSNTADALLSYVTINPSYIPFTRKGQPIKFGHFTDGQDEKSGVYVHMSVARLAKGIPNPKERPVLPIPWELEFEVSLIKNKIVDETLLRTYFETGGMSMGLGTYRPVYGKFFVVSWQENVHG